MEQEKKRIPRLVGEYQQQEINILDEETKGKAALIALNELSLADKTLMMLYSEMASYRKVATELGCSHQSVKNEIERIRKIMKERIRQIELCL